MPRTAPLSRTASHELLDTLGHRFARHARRHADIDWTPLRTRLESDPRALRSLHEMERTGGEPDVLRHDATTDTVLFVDCSAESPAGRRSLCYDAAALASRKANPPRGSAVNMAAQIGIELLSEAMYRDLQRLDEFDTKTSSWILTPPTIRSLGGALFCDRRYGGVFTYHNGAESYYAARGFRGCLRIGPAAR